MYISLNWLRDYVDIPKAIKADELARLLTLHTVEVDDVIDEADKYKDIVAAEIKEVRPHPNADKLQLALVYDGEEREVVCGAPNIEPGQKVPLARPGAKLPGGAEISETEIRGVKSAGMLLAEDELELGGGHEGILVLDKRAKAGQPLGDYLKLQDTIFEVDNKSITHRGDLWGHYGLAREISAFLRAKTTRLFTAVAQDSVKPDKEEAVIDIRVEDHGLCPRYMAAVVDNVRIEESPAWLADRLRAAGVRPINNIVDVTNYVMLDLGQPMHAFDALDLNPDYNQDKSIKIGVRRAKKKESIVTLDKENRPLEEEALLITDQKSPVAIAGIMGGENSEINESTTTIVLESANFEYQSIRRTSGALNLRTEASKRFEKGLDPNMCELALWQAIKLIKKIQPRAQLAGQIGDAKEFTQNRGPIELDLAWLNRFIGQEIEAKEAKRILGSLGFAAEDNGAGLSVSIPSWRATKDIAGREDLAEEVARIYGYNRVEAKPPLVEMKLPEASRAGKFAGRIREILAGSGLNEALTYPFVGEAALEKLDIDFSRHIRLQNPLTRDQALLRQSLAPNLILGAKANQARYNDFMLFEIGTIFLGVDGSYPRDKSGKRTLPRQEKHLAVLASGAKADEVFRRAKGALEHLFSVLHIDNHYESTEVCPPWADNNLAANILNQETEHGCIAVAGPEAMKKNNLKKYIALAELDLGKLEKLFEMNKAYQFRQIAKYPPLIRDLAFVVNEKILYNDIKQEIIDFHRHIASVELFDVYQGNKLGSDRKNLAFHVIYQAGKTLKGEEVEEIQEKLIKHLEKKFEAKIRNF